MINNPDYLQNLQKLFSFKIHNKLGIENVCEVDRLLGFPSQACKTVHVAGTNGKGSVATKLAKAYELTGLKTGLFTSPHLSCFRERIRLNNEMISESAFNAIFDELFALLEKKHLPLSFFEVTTLIAFQYFAKEHADIVIVEAGIGGRLDATNIITPDLSIITSIALDHTEILGHTIDAIAKEKAGIIKEGKPVLIGPHVPMEIIKPIAFSKNAPLYQSLEKGDSYVEENCAIAQLAMSLLLIPQTVQEKALQAQPSCRLELRRVRDVDILLDVAHNPDGLTRLFSAIRVRFPGKKLRVVVGFSKNKDIDECLHILKNAGNYFYPVEASNDRGFPVSKLKEALCPSYNEENISGAVLRAIKEADSPDDLVVICGSFYIMGEARLALGIDEPYDPSIN